eukprot:TRINITY_DN1762_c1_g1_i1.p1 TRINITY_DN1762_c1_g1~~TRINITY_DN1762_c1_g1_i1.p1  ORF type:complete len:206 (-),score=1.85 TRINITY_DN1762_c1_g1_i1:234-851(-)
MLLSMTFIALRTVVVEKIYLTYKYNPLLISGVLYGVGFVICVICLIVFNNINCPPVEDSSGRIQFCHFGVVEDTILGFKQLADNKTLATLVGVYFPVVAGLGFCAFTILKHWSSLVLTIVMCVRTGCVWVFSLIVLWEDFNWLQVKRLALPKQFVGFLLVVGGTILYSESIPLQLTCCSQKKMEMVNDDSQRQPKPHCSPIMNLH